MQISEGEGWRLVLDPERHPYAFLIGGLDWAVELKQQEFACLRRGVITLLEQQRMLLSSLMPEEELELELDLSIESGAEDGNGRSASSPDREGSLYLALSGHPARFSLRFMLTPADGSRAAEGGWSAGASAALVAALEGLTDAWPRDKAAAPGHPAVATSTAATAPSPRRAEP